MTNKHCQFYGKEAAESKSEDLVKTLTNKRIGKRTTNMSDPEVHTKYITSTVTMVTSNDPTEPTPKHLQPTTEPGEEEEEPQIQGGGQYTRCQGKDARGCGRGQQRGRGHPNH